MQYAVQKLIDTIIAQLTDLYYAHSRVVSFISSHRLTLTWVADFFAGINYLSFQREKDEWNFFSR